MSTEVGSRIRPRDFHFVILVGLNISLFILTFPALLVNSANVAANRNVLLILGKKLYLMLVFL